MGPFWTLFADIWAKMNFPGKKGCQILDIPIIYHRPKNQKKLMRHFWEKGQTTRQTDRQWWFYGTLCRPGVQKRSSRAPSLSKSDNTVNACNSIQSIQFKACKSLHKMVHVSSYFTILPAHTTIAPTIPTNNHFLSRSQFSAPYITSLLAISPHYIHNTHQHSFLT